jgi:hypothetical protein
MLTGSACKWRCFIAFEWALLGLFQTIKDMRILIQRNVDKNNNQLSA